MNGVHDMGGMHGFGPVVREQHEPVFHADWEAHVVAINALTRGRGVFNIDEFRHGIELMDPAHYLRSSYYERWLATIEHNLIAKGAISRDELEARVELLRQQPDAPPPNPPREVAPPRQLWSPLERLSEPAPRFAVGDAVVARNTHPTGHTRLPRYARGKQGVIHGLHGAATFPDSNAHGLGERPQPLYSVRFDGRELWGDAAEAGEALYLDLWESYLEPALVPA